jgi:hypothetical protein
MFEGFFAYNQRMQKMQELEDYKQSTTDIKLSEIEKYKKELEKEKTEVINLKTEYEQYIFQTEKREKNLQQHIENISSILNLKDIDQIKQAISELHKQIMDNIEDLEHVKKNEIQKKKKDLEERLSMRLLDAKMKNEEILAEKIHEKEELVKHVEKLSLELEKIKENYGNICNKKIKARAEHNDIRNEVKEFEKENHQLKSRLLDLQSQIIRIHDLLNAKKEKSMKKFKLNNGSRLSFKLEKSNSNIQMSSDEKNINIKYAENLITEEDFVRNNYRSSSVIASLCNILDNNKIKLKHIENKLKHNDKEYNLRERIYYIVNRVKENRFLNNDNQRMAKTCYNTPMLYISLNREQRDLVTDCLVNDKYIKNIFEQGDYQKFEY